MLGRLRSFWNDQSGAGAFEAVFAALFLSFMIAPTLYLLRVSEVQLDGSWAQRTSAREHANFSSCNGLNLANPLWKTLHRDHASAGASGNASSTSRILCLEEEIAEEQNKRFWPRMESVVASDFPTLVDDMKDNGDFMMHGTDRWTTFSEDVELGTTTGTFRDSLIDTDFLGFLNGLIPTIPEAMAPSTDYYRWHKEHWRKGHDRVIWAGFTSDSQKMFPNVFPSR